MYQKIYYVDKTSNTPSDSLAAHGLARVFQSLGVYGVKVVDIGDRFEIRLSKAVTQEMVEKQEFFSPLEYLLTAKSAAKKPKLTTPLNYEQEKERESKFYSYPYQARTDPNHPQHQDAISSAPRPDWRGFQAINQMAAVIGYNELVIRWEENAKNFAEMLKIILFMFSTSPNQIEKAEKAWNEDVKSGKFTGKNDATASQLFNPACGKGQNSTKASALAMGNLSNFWLVEFLKMVGSFEVSAPRLISNPKNPRAKDRKLYVLMPKNMDFEINKKLWTEFQQSFRSDTSVKMDIAAAHLYAKIFLKNSETYAQALAEDDPEGREPENFIAGLWSVFYKDLGNSSAVMNLSFVGLPDWIKHVMTYQQVNQFLEIIEEHENLLDDLNEDRSEDYDLLLTYRNFLSGKDLEAFYDFIADYGRFYMSVTEREWDRRGRFLRLPSITNLEVIMTNHNPDLVEIVEDEGFQRVAYALRHSTVIPQRNKALNPKGERLYEPKYGLIQDLKRKGQYKEEFVEALGDFVSDYNLRTEQVFEHKKGFQAQSDMPLRKAQRKRIEPKHLASVIRLVEQHGSALVCNLLAAFGSGVDTKPKKNPNI